MVTGTSSAQPVRLGLALWRISPRTSAFSVLTAWWAIPKAAYTVSVPCIGWDRQYKLESRFQVLQILVGLPVLAAPGLSDYVPVATGGWRGPNLLSRDPVNLLT